MSSPVGPAEQLAGGSFPRSTSSFCIRFSAMAASALDSGHRDLLVGPSEAIAIDVGQVIEDAGGRVRHTVPRGDMPPDRANARQAGLALVRAKLEGHGVVSGEVEGVVRRQWGHEESE
eukprot:CAMPEP_0198497872 /NCGR_PEP_ID=MMETSP1462-20131121/6654_1 /TAXON_ID=1333877 /ORGANISM="Brandtodinium nutriculum, Strain RCC3387" /LENGTH=117 /DNA_ID=CAMNT_0044226753 /DNA_START=405 /DNA_END=755 /DNA_ORIENTATION=+